MQQELHVAEGAFRSFSQAIPTLASLRSLSRLTLENVALRSLEEVRTNPPALSNSAMLPCTELAGHTCPDLCMHAALPGTHLQSHQHACIYALLRRVFCTWMAPYCHACMTSFPVPAAPNLVWTD